MFKQSRPKGAPCEREGAPVGAPGCGPRGVWWTDRGRGVRAGAAAEPAAALLVAGTYEKAICGWELGRGGSAAPVFQVARARARTERHRHAPRRARVALACLPPGCDKRCPPQHQSHLGPVKAVASQGKFLVSGGNDEEIRIYNIRKRFEVGSLMKHQAPITTLRFSKKANSLVSGSDDGMIAVWRIKDWECVSFKPAHKGSVTDLDVHPSGKVMLSCGRDNTLRLWDLSSTKELYCRSQKVCPDDAIACIRGPAVTHRSMPGGGRGRAVAAGGCEWSRMNKGARSAEPRTCRAVATGDSSSCGGARAVRASATRSATTCACSIRTARMPSCASPTRARPFLLSSSPRRLSLQVCWRRRGERGAGGMRGIPQIVVSSVRSWHELCGLWPRSIACDAS